jgi:hypothetical protein
MSGMTCQQRDSGAGGVGGRNAGQGRGAGSRRLVREEEHGVAVGQVVEVADKNHPGAPLEGRGGGGRGFVRVGDHSDCGRLTAVGKKLRAQRAPLLVRNDHGHSAGRCGVKLNLTLHVP